MMKFVFALLVTANLVLLIAQGWMSDDVREPDRISRQFNAERIVLLLQEPAPAPEPALPAVAPPAAQACLELGDFSKQAAVVFEKRLAQLALPALPKKRTVMEPQTQMVFVPPKNGSAGAAQRLAQLRALGFTDTVILQEPSQWRGGISLGLFKSSESARAQLEQVRRAGVPDARIEPYPVAASRAAYQLRGLDQTMRSAVRAIAVDFPGIETRSCE